MGVEFFAIHYSCDIFRQLVHNARLPCRHHRTYGNPRCSNADVVYLVTCTYKFDAANFKRPEARSGHLGCAAEREIRCAHNGILEREECYLVRGEFT